MRLSELKTGESGIVVKILGHGAFRKRVIEMGFVKGQVIKSLLNAPLRDPIKYSIMGYELSLRRSEAEMVEILPLPQDDNLPVFSHINTIADEDACSGALQRKITHHKRGVDRQSQLR